MLVLAGNYWHTKGRCNDPFHKGVSAAHNNQQDLAKIYAVTQEFDEWMESFKESSSMWGKTMLQFVTKIVESRNITDLYPNLD